MASRFQWIALLLVTAACPALPVRAQKPPVRPRITGIAGVVLYTAHAAQSQDFYGKFLGFEPSATLEPPAIKNNLDPSTLRYRVNPAQWIEVRPLPEGETDFLASIAFTTSNVNALFRYLVSKGVPIPNGVQTQPEGTAFFWTKDPEGHRIQFISSSMLPSSACHNCQAQISGRILHAGFIVHDRAAEDRFFHDILGFREAWHGGMNPGKTDWVDMQVPDGSSWLEYMLHDSSPPSASVSGVLNHLALGVPSIRQAAALLEQRSWTPTPRQSARIGRDGKWQLNLYDPDDTRVELMEFRPVRTPCCAPYTLPVPR